MSKDVLVVHAPNWVGDHVMAFPFYRALMHLFPSHEKILLGRGWISGLVPEKIFQRVITFDAGKNLSSVKINELIAEGIDVGFTLSPSFRSAYMLRKIRAKRIIGYRDVLRQLLIPGKFERGALRIPPVNLHEHRALSYIRLLNPFLTADTIAEDIFFQYRHYTPKIEISPEKKTEIEGILARNGLFKKPYLVICPGSVAPSKIYPLPHLTSLVKLLQSERKLLPVVLVGSSIEKPYAEQFMNICRGFLPAKEKNILIDLTTRTNLAQTQIVLQKAKGIIANDSGVAHLSSFSHTPLVTFQGMGRKEETAPLNKNKKILTLDLPCSPCFKKQCPRKDYPLQCLDSITPLMVLSAMKSLKIIES